MPQIRSGRNIGEGPWTLECSANEESGNQCLDDSMTRFPHLLCGLLASAAGAAPAFFSLCSSRCLRNWSASESVT